MMMKDNKNKDFKDIERLIERFFNGDTTLDEERLLYRFFNSDKVPAGLECYHEMFADFSTLPIKDEDSKVKKTPHMGSIKWLWPVITGVAAILLLAFGLSYYNNVREDRMLAARYEGSYVIENGHKIDDLSEIRNDVETALNKAKSIESYDMVGSTVEQAEQNALNSIADPAERERINAILNE